MKENLKKLLRKRNVSSSKARKLLKGENIPYTAYDSRMKNRVKEEARKNSKRKRSKNRKRIFLP